MIEREAIGPAFLPHINLLSLIVSRRSSLEEKKKKKGGKKRQKSKFLIVPKTIQPASVGKAKGANLRMKLSTQSRPLVYLPWVCVQVPSGSAGRVELKTASWLGFPHRREDNHVDVPPDVQLPTRPSKLDPALSDQAPSVKRRVPFARAG
jgi:hypothetical protein